MKRLLGFGIGLFALAFIITSAYNDYQYNLAIESADSLFVQQESAFLNDWYNEYEQDVTTTESNQQANEKVYINPSPKDEGNIEEPDPLASLEIPVFTSGIEAYMFAENIVNLADGLWIEVGGRVDTNFGVSQTVKNVRKEGNDGELYAYNATYGTFYKMGFEAYYNGRQFKTRETSNVGNDLKSNFSNNWSFTSINAYIAQFGSLPNELNYIVNENTVQEESKFVHENGLYTFTLKLDPKTSNKKYKYAVKANGDAKDLPNFSSVTLEVVMDVNARFQSIRYREKYTLTTMGITAETSTNLLEMFKVIHGEVVMETPSGF